MAGSSVEGAQRLSPAPPRATMQVPLASRAPPVPRHPPGASPRTCPRGPSAAAGGLPGHSRQGERADLARRGGESPAGRAPRGDAKGPAAWRLPVPCRALRCQESHSRTRHTYSSPRPPSVLGEGRWVGTQIGEALDFGGLCLGVFATVIWGNSIQCLDIGLCTCLSFVLPGEKNQLPSPE